MKFQSFFEILFNKKKRNNFPFMNISIKQPFGPWTLQTGYFRGNFFDFWSFMIQNKFFMYFFNWVIVELSKTVTEARCIVLEIANVLKIVIFPSRVKFLIIQIFKRDFQNMIFEVLFIFKFSVVRRMNSKNFHCVS